MFAGSDMTKCPADNVSSCWSRGKFSFWVKLLVLCLTCCGCEDFVVFTWFISTSWIVVLILVGLFSFGSQVDACPFPAPFFYVIAHVLYNICSQYLRLVHLKVLIWSKMLTLSLLPWGDHRTLQGRFLPVREMLNKFVIGPVFQLRYVNRPFRLGWQFGV